MKISSLQQAAIGRNLEAAFDARAMRHVQAHFPRELGLWRSTEDLKEQVCASVAAARRLGIRSDAALLCYATLAMIWGVELEKNACGSLRKILCSHEMRESDCVREIDKLIDKWMHGFDERDTLWNAIQELP